MFEIDSDDILQLDDLTARELVARLCLAEASKYQWPRTDVHWDGDQRAADGGIDVQIIGSAVFPANHAGTIKNPNTIFQVKAEEFGPSQIPGEMTPGGNLRPAIRALSDVGGAYIIVGSKARPAGDKFAMRIDAMRTALGPLASSIEVDFFGARRLADWVNQYPGVLAWVRQKIGRPMAGWLPHGAWDLRDPQFQNDEYIPDGSARVQRGQGNNGEPTDCINAITTIRDLLNSPGKSVRLVGLSGTGKTRLAEALFDHRIGERALGAALAVYTAGNAPPDPSAATLIEQLKSNATRSIIIVDNCASELHRTLANAVKNSTSVSLLSIEYDIREDDLRETGTDVFHIELASDDVIDTLLERRFPQLGNAFSRRICELSNGNTRVALLLARAWLDGSPSAQLSDNDIFDRLFLQRNTQDSQIKRAAEAMSLVYSFDLETTASPEAELPLLAAFVDQTVDEFYRTTNELFERGIVQRRGKWRALLPPALANRFAQSAIRATRPEKMMKLFLDAPDRMKKSMTKRLGYLHECEEAQRFASEHLLPWTKINGSDSWCGVEADVFENIAPLDQKGALASIKEALDNNLMRAQPHWSIYHNRIIRLLAKLAYEPELFGDAAIQLVKIALEPQTNTHNQSPARDALKKLYQRALSGTHAPLYLRAALLNNLLDANNEDMNSLGCKLLGSMLNMGSVSGADYSFGALPRDYGYCPQTREQLQEWVRLATELAEKYTGSQSPNKIKVRQIFGENIRSLYLFADMKSEISDMVRRINADSHWPEAVQSLKFALCYNAKEMDDVARAHLTGLIAELVPTQLIDRIRTHVLVEERMDLHLSADTETEIDSETRYKVAENAASQCAYDLGVEVISKPDVLEAVLPELMLSAMGKWQDFVRGMALGAAQPIEIWNLMLHHFDGAQHPNGAFVLASYLRALQTRDTSMVEKLLDDALISSKTCELFPILQAAVPLDVSAVARLQRYLDESLGPPTNIVQMSWACAHGPENLAIDIIVSLSQAAGGNDPAIQLADTILMHKKPTDQPITPAFEAAAVNLLKEWQPQSNHPNSMHDYHTAELVKCCLIGPETEPMAQEMLKKIADARMANTIGFFACETLEKELYKAHPSAALDVFHASEDLMARNDRYAGRGNIDFNAVFSEIPVQPILAWARLAPDSRYQLLVFSVPAFSQNAEELATALSSHAIAIINEAPDKDKVVQALLQQLQPSSWTGTLTSHVEPRVAAIRALNAHDDLRVRQAVARIEQDLKTALETAHKRDKRFEVDDQRFE